MYSPPDKRAGDRGGGAVAPQAAGKKRRRDIGTMKVFKEHMYAKGMATFHALVEQNPTLMYPPEGIDAAREHQKLLGILQEHAAGTPLTTGRNEAATAAAPPEAPAAVDIDRFLHELDFPKGGAGTAGDADQVPPPPSPRPKEACASHNLPAPSEPRAPSERDARQDEALVGYHRKQLAALVALFYDFNHTEFVKLPMKQTVDLLLRCGRESYAHLAEFEQLERARKARVLEGRVAVRQLKQDNERYRQQGREAYYESQLALAEETQQRIDNAAAGRHATTIHHTIDDDDDDAMNDLADHLPNHDDDGQLFSMFPDDDDEEPISGATGTLASTALAVDDSAVTDTLRVADIEATAGIEYGGGSTGDGTTQLHAGVADEE